MISRRSFVVTSVGALSLPAFAAESGSFPARAKFHLYLLIGQSNMAGRGALDDEAKNSHPRLLKFSKDEAWVPAVEPLHFDKPIAGVGLGGSFGRAMAEGNRDAMIGLIPCAVGGTPLSRWVKGADLYEQAVVRAKAAMKSGTLKGILWHQGEADSGSESTARSYGERLAKMVGDLRAELGVEAPFLAGQLGEFLATKGKEGKPSFWPVVNEQIASLPGRLPNFAFVASTGLNHKGDGVHFDTAALREFGKRYAVAMQKLHRAG